MKQKRKLPVSSVDNTIETMGDRWTIFITREAFFGSKTFEQFQANLGIATNILSAHLKKLVLKCLTRFCFYYGSIHNR
ncbi:MAG: hypothetical protein A2031_03620 [Deltaproteobacteria bacterium RBG_19FT_COMBO_43_11]|nr:MAG: hypothetical protein A2W27_08980 [Deltaproteobacteria bacterium RBG_16_44_11]OGP90764.1 MAG: hypothetical protein A2031_03620 [Deltaproteobacteria bacterium RBG_19FT_COMBO_43_11]